MKAAPSIARRVPAFRACASSPASASRSTPRRSCGAQEVLGLPIHDNWWQTETGGIMIANTPAMDIKPGSMGRPLPGIDAAIVRRREDGGVEEIDEPDVEGELALRPAGRRCSAATCNEEERYRKCFAGGWYLHRRPRPARRRRLLLVRRPRRRRDQVRRPPDRPVRGRERADGASGGRRGRRHRQARPGRRRGGQGVRLAEGRLRPRATSCARSCSASRRKRLGAAVAPKEIDVRRRAAAHPQRQDHAPPAEGPRARAARGRHLDAGGRRMSATPQTDPVSRTTRELRAARCSREMLRIRRFEEKCAELYGAAKIRGFLHLYIGEEAVAAGAMHALDAGGRDRRHLPRARPRAGARHVRRPRSWPRCTASAKAARAAAAARCTCSTRRRASTAATPSSAAGCRSPSAWRWPTRCRSARRVTACFFGDGAVAEGEFHESLNLAALWQLPVLFCCENNLYAMGTALARSESQTDLLRQGRGLTACRRCRSTAWTCVAVHEAARERAATRARRRRPVLPGVPDLPLPRPLDVRPRAVPRQGRGRGVEEARPDPHLTAPAQGRGHADRGRSSSRIDARSRRRGRRRRSPSPRPAPGSRSRT